MPSYLSRYQKDKCVTVWDEIYRLGEKAFESGIYEDVTAVLHETMQRTRYNIDLIHQRLREQGYSFLEILQPARLFPDDDTERLLSEIEKNIGQLGGAMPLSLKAFYRIVGSVNFVWDYENRADESWFDYADPLFVVTPYYLLEDTGADWRDRMTSGMAGGYITQPYLFMAPDFYHKDDVSGGEAYSIEITSKPAVDGRLLYGENDELFIQYLRRCFLWGGFPRVAVNNRGYETKISRLKQDLKPI